MNLANLANLAILANLANRTNLSPAVCFGLTWRTSPGSTATVTTITHILAAAAETSQAIRTGRRALAASSPTSVRSRSCTSLLLLLLPPPASARSVLQLRQLRNLQCRHHRYHCRPQLAHRPRNRAVLTTVAPLFSTGRGRQQLHEVLPAAKSGLVELGTPARGRQVPVWLECVYVVR